MPRVDGYIITWKVHGHDVWEYTNSLEMILYLYDNAIKLCGEENTYVFPIHDVLTLGETRNLIAGLRHEYEELTR